MEEERGRAGWRHPGMVWRRADRLSRPRGYNSDVPARTDVQAPEVAIVMLLPQLPRKPAQAASAPSVMGRAYQALVFADMTGDRRPEGSAEGLSHTLIKLTHIITLLKGFRHTITKSATVN